MRAGRLPGVEVEGKRGLVIPGACLGLGGGVQQHRADQRDPEHAGSVDDQLGRRVTRIDQVLAGQQPPLLQLLMDRSEHRGVGNGRLGRGHAGDQVRPVTPPRAGGRCRARVRVRAGLRFRVVAGLGEVDFVPAPAVVPLDAVAGVKVIRGDQAVSARRETVPSGSFSRRRTSCRPSVTSR